MTSCPSFGLITHMTSDTMTEHGIAKGVSLAFLDTARVPGGEHLLVHPR